MNNLDKSEVSVPTNNNLNNTSEFKDNFDAVPTPNPVNKIDFQKYASYAKWMKFLAIMMFIGAVPMVIAGFPMLLALGLGLLYLAAAAVMIYSGVLLLNAATELEKLSQQKEPEYALKTLDQLGLYFKVQGIMTLVSLIIGALGLLALFGFMGATMGGFFNSLEKGDWNTDYSHSWSLDNSSNSSSLNYNSSTNIIENWDEAEV